MAMIIDDTSNIKDVILSLEDINITNIKHKIKNDDHRSSVEH